MTAILHSIIGRRKVWQEDIHNLHAIYGDLNITAPNGYPTKLANTHIREVEAGYDLQFDDNNLSRRSSEVARSNGYRQGRRSTDVLVSAHGGQQHTNGSAHMRQTETSSRQRSRSQSAGPSGRDSRSDHRARSASSNRAGHVRQSSDDHHGTIVQSSKTVSNENQSSKPRFTGVMGTTISPADHSMYARQSNQYHTKSFDNSDRLGQSTRVSQDRLSNLRSGSERMTCLTTMLSPVTEKFSPSELSQPQAEIPGVECTAQQHQTILLRDERPAFPPSLPNMGISPSKQESSVPAPAPAAAAAAATSIHRAEFVNPLAAHNPHQSKGHQRQNSQSDTQGPSRSKSTQPPAVDKPLPPCPVGTSQTPPLECTSFMRASSRAWPGLETTSVMRPSPNRCHQPNQSQPQSVAARSHQRSASFSHANHTGTLPNRSTPSSMRRKDSNPEELARINPITAAPSTASRQVITTKLSAATVAARPPPSDQLSDLSAHAKPSTPSPPPGLTTSAANSSKVGGNMYNEIRDDLRGVARDLNTLSLTEQLERDRKLSKLRRRARSASRHDRFSERHRDHESQNNYTLTHASSRRSFDGGLENDLSSQPRSLSLEETEHRLGGKQQNSKTQNQNQTEEIAEPSGKKTLASIEMVPDPDDLWS